jgi:hypothetical protein
MSSARRGQAAAPPPPPSPPTPPPPASSSSEEFDSEDSTDLLHPVRDAAALAEAEKEAQEELAGHAALDAELEQRRLAAAAAAEDSDSEISWSSDDPDAPTPEERAAEQRAIVESFETLKDDAANARLEQCLQEDAAAHRAIAAAREAAEKQATERRNDGAGPSGSK